MWQFKSEGCLLLEFHLEEGRSFFLFMPSADWMRLTYIMECNMLYSKST